MANAKRQIRGEGFAVKDSWLLIRGNRQSDDGRSGFFLERIPCGIGCGFWRRQL
jgi:hypothetical protein